MRVAVVAMETSHYRDTEGRRRIERVAGELADAGHEVSVFCSQWWDGYGKRFAPEEVTYRAVTVSPTVPSFCTRLPALLANYRPDVIHAVPSPPSVLLAASLGGTLSRAPLVVEWYGDEALPEARRTDWSLRAPDQFVTPSELVQTGLWEAGAPDDRTTIVPESIDMDLVREVDPAEEVDVVYAHPLDESANMESLFLALAELRQKDWSATVVGDGPQREVYEQEAADLRIDDRVEFVGACDRERRVSIYKGAQVFVQTAFREYFATDLLWALAAGCIGIVEYQAGSSAHELVEQRDRAFRVTNPQEIADKIVASADMERRTVDESLAAFDHDAVRGEYESLYERLVEAYGFF
ncbi:glycosyltransferase family 4 protein [Halomicroarcula sp. S1AR25-4]|uniref:glycosyltransferase family 4 protein n=1 Tax=Haloarcula sp. S1AR25-4 TaxID=2950538 RepID=UPI002874279C|nr:glycosyltransferase family 4 protein [Halomicroarcula sp. S1AR25-4]MDS0277312.1 glycosyltransferase family 4 protein [Halomicroarcula sp. S1AR25-4]